MVCSFENVSGPYTYSYMISFFFFLTNELPYSEIILAYINGDLCEIKDASYHNEQLLIYWKN